MLPLPTTTAAPRVGDYLEGAYRLVRVLEAGASSQVFEAEDTSRSRRVAIKITQQRARLMNEARALVTVTHPSLPAVHGVGVHDDWTYLALEWIEGITLAAHLSQARNEPISLEEGVSILAPLADALAAVHAAGLAHRDLEAGNVMLSLGRVVLLDFDNVDMIEGAPAQLVDIHAFGALAHEVFTRRRPQSIGGAPPYLAVTRPDLPRRMSELVFACLQPDPARRPQDLAAIARELRALVPAWAYKNDAM